MATDQDFTFRGTKNDARLKAMHDALPWFDELAHSNVAGLIFLDKEAGVYSEDNSIVMAAGYAMWFILEVEVCDPEIRDLMSRCESTDDEDEAERLAQQVDALMTTRKFEISFTHPEMEYPDFIAGKTIRMRVMTEEEAEKLDFACCTVSPDGKVVQLPTTISDIRL